MTFTEYLKAQFTLHPTMQPQDFVKLCYQAAFGAEHLLLNLERAKAYFMQEWEATPANAKQPLYEEISEHICRINMAAWKAQNRSAELLFAKFADSATIPAGSKELFENYLNETESFICHASVPFTLKDWTTFLAEYKKIGSPAVHHSERYHKAEHPSYRIVRKEYLEELLAS